MGSSSSTVKHLASTRRVVVIAGPTAVGKSALALKLCEELQGELISVDSVQVYRGLRIGSNKPSEAEVAAVRHHLLDVRDPDEEYTAGAFYADALRAVEDIHARGKLPVLVGGTSMYMRWLARGRPTAPKADPAIAESVRLQLAPLEAASDWDSGIAKLEELDPVRAAQLSRNDWYRLQRAICVALQTDSTAAALSRPDDSDGLDALRDSLDMRCFFVCAPRIPLCQRIDERCDIMLGKGLLEETTDALLGGRLLPSSPAGRSIGYRQALSYLTRPNARKGDAKAYNDFVGEFAAASRRYASQQTKWFRSEPSFEWVAADWDAPAKVERLVASRITCERPEYDAGLASARQEELRQKDPHLDKAMKIYEPNLPSLADPDAVAAMLTRADACRERIEPRLEELMAADAEMSERFPWHRRDGEQEEAGSTSPKQQQQPKKKAKLTAQDKGADPSGTDGAEG